MDTNELNQYGDHFRPTENGHGVDIASQRQDELDLASIAWVRQHTEAGRKITAIDLGGGFGAHSVCLAEAGAEVAMVDIADMATENFRKAVESGRVQPGQLHFVCKDFATLSAEDIPDNYDVLYSQRAIHYIPYAEACKVLKLLVSKMAHDGQAYVSAAGFDTEYGKTYPDRGKPIEERFALVTPEMQKKHGITQPIVTYREAELAALLKDAGFTNVKVTHSPFGNIKAMALKL
jgi:hypothetical protein